INIVWGSSTGSTKIDALWLGYLMARANYVGSHEDAYDPSTNPPPLFEEEIEGRTKAVLVFEEFKRKDRLRNSYFEDLLKVHLAGYMRAYVWRHFRQKYWEENKAPENLEAFDRWAQQNIPNHEPMTFGAVVLKPR